MRKFALLGICNSKNVLESDELKDEVQNIFYAFQPCLLDIVEKKNNGLSIPMKDFYTTEYVAGKEETATFTKKTMQMDLNKTTLTSLETLNPDYLVIDISSLTMRHYRLTYKDKSVFSVNAYSPLCYEDLQKTVPELKIERVYVSNEQAYEALDKLATYLKENWDLTKILLFYFDNPKMYIMDGKVAAYDTGSWFFEQAAKIKDYNDYFISLLGDKVKVFKDLSNKISLGSKSEIAKKSIPSCFHSNERTVRLQGLAFKNFIHSKKDVSLDVCIPCHNGSEYLRTTIPNIITALRKLHIKWDLHLLCHNSNDSTLSILKSFEDYNIHIYEKKEQCTLGEVRNFFLENKSISNDYICYIDSDDLVNEDFFLQFENLNRSLGDKNLFICTTYNRCIRTSYDDAPKDFTALINPMIYVIKNEIKLKGTGSFYKKSVIDSNSIRFPLCNIFEGETFNIRYFDCLDDKKSVCMLNAIYVMGPRGETTISTPEKKSIAYKALISYISLLKKQDSKKELQKFIERLTPRT